VFAELDVPVQYMGNWLLELASLSLQRGCPFFCASVSMRTALRMEVYFCTVPRQEVEGHVISEGPPLIVLDRVYSLV